MSRPPEQDWKRTVLSGLGAIGLAAVGLGLIIGGVAVAATNLSGLGDDSASTDAPATLYMPPYTKTPNPDAPKSIPPVPNITGIPLDPTDGPSGEGEITLNADQTAVAPGEQISFSGAYDAEDGTVLQIQRREGAAWIDFPAEATVRNGAFTTYVFTSRTGDNIWRLFDPDTGRSSNSVTVAIG